MSRTVRSDSRGVHSCSLFIAARVFIMGGGAVRETDPVSGHNPCFGVVGSQNVSLSVYEGGACH